MQPGDIGYRRDREDGTVDLGEDGATMGDSLEEEAGLRMVVSHPEREE